MKKIGILMILCLVVVSVFAQNNQSYFYNEKGQFLLDTTLTISKNQYYKWIRAEFNLIAAFSHVDYPAMQLDNSIEAKEQVIVSFTIDSSRIKNIEVLNESGAFATSIKEGIKKQEGRIIELLRSKDEERYYIAYNFKLIKFYEELKKANAIPIIRSSKPFISRSSGPLIGVPLKN